MTRPTIARIQEAVSRHYGFDVAAMTGPSRVRALAYPRQEAMFLARRFTGKSFTVLGQRFHRDHSTVITGIQSVKARCCDPAKRAELLKLARIVLREARA